jgi:dTDP-4-dehydrorhamnose 3,5-epimerase
VKISQGPLLGIWVIEARPHVDERGSFARIFCQTEFADRGLPECFPQANLSHNRRAGTLRGLHFQWPPSREGKLVRCVAGAVFDAMVDLRPDSSTFAQHFTISLSEANGLAVYIPQGFAHGFQTLADGATVLYQMTEAYRPGLDGGYRYDEPAFAIEWPRAASTVSERDRAAPPFDASLYRAEHARRARASVASSGRAVS